MQANVCRSLAVVAFFLFLDHVAAQTLEKVKAEGAITLGYREAAIPFSYLDDEQRPIGYSMDICARVVDAVKVALKMPNLKLNLNPVIPSTRIALIANGTIDLECGVSTNNAERAKQVSFSPTVFVAGTRLLYRKALTVASLGDLRGKTVVSPSGSTNIKVVMEQNKTQQLGINVVAVEDLPEGFLMLETGRAAAFATDDVMIYSILATAKSPASYSVSKFALSTEPYGIMLRRGDQAFKKVVDSAITAMAKNGDLEMLYTKWFASAIPPRGLNLKMPMSTNLRRVLMRSNDSSDPRDYE